MNNPFSIYSDTELTHAVNMYALSSSKQAWELRRAATETLLLRLCKRFATAGKSRYSLCEKVSKELVAMGWDWTPALVESWAAVYSDVNLELAEDE